MLIDRITGVAHAAGGTGAEIHLAGGHVVAAAPVGCEVDAPNGSAVVLDVAGRAVLPGFVDAHVHLDKAFTLAAAEAVGPVRPHLGEAIQAVERLRSSSPLGQVRERARRAVDTMVAHGTVAGRVHVEIGPVTGSALVDLHQALAADVADRCLLQLVAFPQLGLATTASRAALDHAVDAGLDVVGGCPYVDDDPLAHLDHVFGLAERKGLPVDLHLDFSDDPSRSLLGAVAARTRALGMGGHVTVGHATTLAAMPPDDRSRAFEDLAGAGIALVVLPFSDLHLAGHGDPGTRSVVDVGRAVDAGVRVAIGTNNLDNPFAPSGNGSLLHAAWLTGIVQRASGAVARQRLLAAVSSTPAAILGLEPHGPVVGSPAHLAVVDSDDAAGAVSSAPSVVATIRAGRLVHERRALQVLDPEVCVPGRSVPDVVNAPSRPEVV